MRAGTALSRAIAAVLAMLLPLETFVGVASIGGAGAYDGIVLSGLIAAYLA